MKAAVVRRDTCRLCDSPDCELILPLEPAAIADEYVPEDRLGVEQPAYPLDLFLCRNCGHVQLLDVLDPEVLFGNYIYTTSTSPGLVEHFRRYAGEIQERLAPPPGSLAIDIGSNDGSLLRFLKEAGFEVLGVDPAREIARRATESGIPTVPRFFDSQVARDLLRDHGPARIVTANNAYAHSDHLGDITDGIRELLAPDGVFVFEVSNLLDFVEHVIFDYVHHEHLSYHSVKPLRAFLDRHGLELFDIQRIETKGGSLRGFAQRKGGPRPIAPSVDALVAEEDAAGLDRIETFRAFADRVQALKDGSRALLQEAKDAGATIAGYGSSATVTTLIYHFGLDEFLDFIVDDNAGRHGLYSPGHHIPVISPDALYERSPEYVVVLAWRFADPIVGKHQEYLDRGGRFVVPVPDIRVLDAAYSK